MVPEAIVPVLGGAVILVVIGSSVLWVGLEAASRDQSQPWLWVTLTFVSGLFYPVVLYALRRRHARTRAPGRWYYLSRSVAIASLVSMIVGAVTTPPDPFSQVMFLAGAIPTATVVVFGIDHYLG